MSGSTIRSRSQTTHAFCSFSICSGSEALRRHPQWYNALTDNCTSSITSYLARNHIGGLSRWDWRLLLNGLGDQMLYDDGDLATGGLSFKALSEQARINEEAKSLGDDPDFSRDIRRGHPGF